ncbi:unnamed protein product [Arabidopsis halleri]
MIDLAQWLEESNNLIVSENMSSLRTNLNSYQSRHAELMSLTMVQDKPKGVKKENGYMYELEGLEKDNTTLRQGKEQPVIDLTKNKGMRLYGFISGHKVVVAIDSGATNNFISDELALGLKLPISTTNQVSVLLGERQCIQSV